MTYKIKKGKHRAWPISIGLFYDRESISKTICFDDSCRYVINDDDKYDTNKVFGIAFFTIGEAIRYRLFVVTHKRQRTIWLAL